MSRFRKMAKAGYLAAWRVKRRLRGLRGQPKSLHLGCGPIRLQGWCNVDIGWTRAVDVLDDIRTLRKFPDGFAGRIYACHVLEHFSHAESARVLAQWKRVLRPGGELRISVPDLDRIVKIYRKNWKHFQTPGNSPWIGLIYGGQLDAHDFHKTGFNKVYLTGLLEAAGFAEVQEYPHFPHFVPGVRDASLAREPFGEYVSLNLKALRP